MVLGYVLRAMRKSKDQIRAERAARLREARKDAGFEDAKSAHNANKHRWGGDSYEAYKAHESGGRGMSRPGIIERYAETFGVRAAWLSSGELPKRAEGGSGAMLPAKAGITFRTVPRLTFKEAAKMPSVLRKLDPQSHEPMRIDADPLVGPNSFYIVLDDDSMIARPPKGEDSFRAGDTVIFDPDQPVANGDFVCALLDGHTEAIFRKYRTRAPFKGQPSYELVPLNEVDYSIVRIPQDSGAKILARMVRFMKNYPPKATV